MSGPRPTTLEYKAAAPAREFGCWRVQISRGGEKSFFFLFFFQLFFFFFFFFLSIQNIYFSLSKTYMNEGLEIVQESALQSNQEAGSGKLTSGTSLGWGPRCRGWEEAGASDPFCLHWS